MLTAFAIGMAFVFNGGDLSDFVQQYARAAQGLDGFVAAAERPIPPMEFEMPTWTDKEGLAKVGEYVAGRMGADLCQGEPSKDSGWSVQVFRPKALPMWLAPGWSDAKFGAYDDLFPPHDDGLARHGDALKPPCLAHRYATGQSLEVWQFSKPVKVHWLLKHCHFAAAGSFSERCFLSNVAVAMGGKLEETADAYIVDLDPAVYRQQLTAYWAEKRSGLADPYQVAYIDYRLAALAAFSDAQIKEAMATEHSYVNVRVAQDSPVGKYARAVLEACLYRWSDPSSKSRKVDQDSKDFLALADMSKPFNVYMSAPRGIMLRLDTLEPGGALEP